MRPGRASWVFPEPGSADLFCKGAERKQDLGLSGRAVSAAASQLCPESWKQPGNEWAWPCYPGWTWLSLWVPVLGSGPRVGIFLSPLARPRGHRRPETSSVYLHVKDLLSRASVFAPNTAGIYRPKPSLSRSPGYRNHLGGGGVACWEKHQKAPERPGAAESRGVLH